MRPKRCVFFKSKNRKRRNSTVIINRVFGDQYHLCPRDSVNNISMNSTITIGDTDDEVIDLDSSQDAINDTDNDQSERFSKNTSLQDYNTATQNSVIQYVENNENIDKSQHCDESNTSKPLLRVIFRDENISREYSKQIKKFLEELVSSKIKCEENNDSLEFWEDTDSTSQSAEVTTESEESQDVICDTLFTVDTQPKLENNFDVPTYGKKYENAFEESSEKPKSANDCSPKVMCFNCMENHNLKDCPEPRNYANINKNRKLLNMKGNSKVLRYHLEDVQRFAHIVPGQISNNLRKALGLRDNELPKHIYCMRILGYPPGWLEEARLQHSGLTLFNCDGVAEDDPTNEPGEIFEDGDRDQYDIKKIYDFPGFNVPPPPGTRDDYKHYGAPKMLPIHSKEVMLSMFSERRASEGYKRKKLKISNTTHKNEPPPQTSEMEVEDLEENVTESVPINEYFVPPLPQESIVKPPEPSEQLSELSQKMAQGLDNNSQELPYSESLENIPSPPSGADSPSLSNLESMRRRLMAELQETSSQFNSDDLVKNEFVNSTPKASLPNNEVTPESNRFRQSGANTSCGSIKSIDLGTPILQSSSPYSKLPSSEKFSKNICDVINFENLADSTGKYEQMSDVLQKVRNTLAKLHQE